MDYELCKKLKDAGFPIKDEDIGEMTWKPTLSELIEAIGRHFALQELEEGKWHAQRFGEPEKVDGYGSTPEEAVINLWLALNSK